MIAGRYALEREVGRGGMGAVWLARDDLLGRQVAMKRIGVLPGHEAPDVERVAREARLAARLNHPNVVAVFDLVDDGAEHWLVMEYVDGVSLASLIKRVGRLSPDQAAPILRQTAEALLAAHHEGITHRDVKPSNILVTPEGQAKLTDFGIARGLTDPSLTQTGLVTGSPAFLSPEVACGQAATTASDVWAIGATAFNALAGQPPYDVGENLMGALYRIVHEDPPRPADSGWLAPMLANTMTREPEHRWSMDQVAAFLARGPHDPVLHPAPESAAVEGHTRVMPAVRSRRRAVAAPPDTGPPVVPVPAPVPEAVAPQPAPAPTESPRRRSRLIPALVLAAVLVIGLAVWAVLSESDPATLPNGPAAPSTAQSAPDGSATSAAPKDPAKEMEKFVKSYLATVTKDPAEGWSMLTPEFQAASGDYDSYVTYWSGNKSAKVLDISADPTANTVHYTVEYQTTSGTSVVNDVTLQLARADGGYLIAGES